MSPYHFLLHCQTTQSFSIPCTIISGLSLLCINCPSIWLKHCSITHVRQAYLSAICHDIRQQPKLAWKRLSSVFGHIVHKGINYQNLNCPLLNGIYSYTIATIYENDLLDVFPAVLLTYQYEQCALLLWNRPIRFSLSRQLSIINTSHTPFCCVRNTLSPFFCDRFCLCNAWTRTPRKSMIQIAVRDPPGLLQRSAYIECTQNVLDMHLYTCRQTVILTPDHVLSVVLSIALALLHSPLPELARPKLHL